MRRATMRDVAAAAGVSFKTVSRVVNDEPGVSGPLVDRVHAAVAALGYRHNLAARSLRHSEQRTASMAVLLQDLSNSFSAELMRAIDDVARERDLVVMATSLDEEEERELGLVANLIKRRVDGLIMMPASRDHAYLQREVIAGFHVVLIDRPPINVDVDFVGVDNVGGARQATNHLLQQGHRRIALITDEVRVATARQRLDGYRTALAQAGVAYDGALVRAARSREAAAEAVQELLASANPPTAVFSARNVITEGTALALRRAGLSDRIAMVGFDDLPWADLLSPGITVIKQDALAVGRLAAELLLSRMEGSTDPPRHQVLPVQLIPRGSGEIQVF
jgi:LacI family transcriptional regulator